MDRRTVRWKRLRYQSILEVDVLPIMIPQSIPYRLLFEYDMGESPLWIRSEMIRYLVSLDWHSLVIAYHSLAITYHSFDTRQQLASREASVEDFTDLGE